MERNNENWIIDLINNGFIHKFDEMGRYKIIAKAYITERKKNRAIKLFSKSTNKGSKTI